MTQATRSSSSRVAPAAASAAPEPDRTNDAPGPAGAPLLTREQAVQIIVSQKLAGHVDPEDMAFMDARLPLAGYELGYGGPEHRRQVPPEFWAGYRRHKQVNPTHAATRDLFQLFYLLAWTRNLYSADHRDPTKQEEEVRRYARAILGRATHAAAVVAPWA